MIQHFFHQKSIPLSEANFIVAPIPYEGGISYLPGAVQGPQAILNASEQLESYDIGEQVELAYSKIHTLPMPSVFPHYRAMHNFVTECVDALDLSKQFYLGIGGDHCVTIPAVEAFHTHSDLGIIQIDAHADLRDSYNDDPYSHACIMRRIVQSIDPKKVLSIGVRAICREEHEFMKKHKMPCIYGNRPLHEDILSDLNEKLGKLPQNVFITIDLDGLDPTVMPHVGTPVPGGLSWHQTLGIIRRIFERKAVVGADVVEIASGNGTERSDFLAAVLCQKILFHAQQAIISA